MTAKARGRATSPRLTAAEREALKLEIDAKRRERIKKEKAVERSDARPDKPKPEPKQRPVKRTRKRKQKPAAPKPKVTLTPEQRAEKRREIQRRYYHRRGKALREARRRAAPPKVRGIRNDNGYIRQADLSPELQEQRRERWRRDAERRRAA